MSSLNQKLKAYQAIILKIANYPRDIGPVSKRQVYAWLFKH